MSTARAAMFSPGLLFEQRFGEAWKQLTNGLAHASTLDDEKQDGDLYTSRERAEMLCGIRYTVSMFYALAVETHVHAFHEFTALLNHFMFACQAAEAAGRRWVHANECASDALTFERHQLDYLDKKLRCMFGFGLALDEKGRGDERRST